MTEKIERDAAEIGIRLLDDAYMTWFAAQSECEHALHAWFKGTSRNCAEAYCTYRAALDREEAAARDLQRLGELAQLCCESLMPSENGVAVRDIGKRWQMP